MTDGEVEEYINQIAFSGAEAFLEKYETRLMMTRLSVTSDLFSTQHLW